MYIKNIHKPNIHLDSSIVYVGRMLSFQIDFFLQVLFTVVICSFCKIIVLLYNNNV